MLVLLILPLCLSLSLSLSFFLSHARTNSITYAQALFTCDQFTCARI